jgi:putative ABC transport system permease protein
MTAVAVLSLGLATGPNAALFGVLNTLFVRSIPAVRPEELVGITATKDNRSETISYPDYRDLAEGSRVFSAVFAWERRAAHLSVRGWDELFPANGVTSNYFQGLGVKPALGRLFLELGDRAGAETPVVISHSLWQRRFGGAEDVLNQAIQMDERPLVIVALRRRTFGAWIPVGRSMSGSR